MNNPQEEYNRLHDHCQAIARERDNLQLQVQRLIKESEEKSKIINKAQLVYRKLKATIEMLQTDVEIANHHLLQQWVANATEMP